MPEPPATLTRQVWSAEPSDRLRPHVRAFIAQAIEVPPGETARLTIAATVYPVLTVTASGVVYSDLHPEGMPPIPELAITGPVPVAFRPLLAGSLRGFFAQLEPAAPLALFGILGEALASNRPLRQLVAPDVVPLLDAWGTDIAAAGDGDEAFRVRVARTERLFADCLELASLAPARDRAATAARMAARVIETDGTRRVRDVAGDLRVAESTLRRRFTTDLGLAPKPFSAVVRFRHALAYLRAHPGASWAGVAARFGYADQSHLIRDYRRFAGVVPSRWDDAERFVDLTFGILEGGSGE